jgi:hypothetical protein
VDDVRIPGKIEELQNLYCYKIVAIVMTRACCRWRWSRLEREARNQGFHLNGVKTVAHEDAGKYAEKHAPWAVVEEKLAAAIGDKAEQGEIACVQAEMISDKLGVELGVVGTAIDLLEIRLKGCQLGLFGFSSDRFPEGRAVVPAEKVNSDLEAAIRSCLVAGRLPCKSAWEIASRMGIAKMAVSSACESLKIRVKPCQLGAF